jgi:sulfite exporter TauE/SafE
MNSEIVALSMTAASVGFVHTLIGPDHYLPFIAMSQARGWRKGKTLLITFLCGLGHVLSSVVLGAAGVALGIAVAKLERVESARGNIAGWLMIAFGLAYFLWGLKRAIRNRPHAHLHGHPGEFHDHPHPHTGDHVHVHASGKANITPWILFTIFVFGPCEPLIPILMYPAAKQSVSGMMLVTAVFAVFTIGTMLAVVSLSTMGLKFLPLRPLERYSHAAAGAIILLCGFAIQVLGL